METAAVIHVAGPHSIRMAWRTHYVGHLRAVNNNFLDTYQLKSQNASWTARASASSGTATASGSRSLRPHRRGRQGAALRPGASPAPASPSTRRSSTRAAGPSWSSTTGSRRRPRRGSRSTSPASTSPARSPSSATSRSPRAASSTASATACARCTRSSSAVRHDDALAGHRAGGHPGGDHRRDHRPGQPDLGAVAAVRRPRRRGHGPADGAATWRRCRSRTSRRRHSGRRDAAFVTLEYGPGPRPGRPVRHHGARIAQERRAGARRHLPAPGGPALPRRRAGRHPPPGREPGEPVGPPDVHVAPLAAFLVRPLPPMTDTAGSAAARRSGPGALGLLRRRRRRERTLRANEEAFARLRIVPRVLRGVGEARPAHHPARHRAVHAGADRADRVPPARAPRRRGGTARRRPPPARSWSSAWRPPSRSSRSPRAGRRPRRSGSSSTRSPTWTSPPPVRRAERPAAAPSWSPSTRRCSAAASATCATASTTCPRGWPARTCATPAAGSGTSRWTPR
jgi:hypothetical protein